MWLFWDHFNLTIFFYFLCCCVLDFSFWFFGLLRNCKYICRRWNNNWNATEDGKKAAHFTSLCLKWHKGRIRMQFSIEVQFVNNVLALSSHTSFEITEQISIQYGFGNVYLISHDSFVICNGNFRFDKSQIMMISWWPNLKIRIESLLLELIALFYYIWFYKIADLTKIGKVLENSSKQNAS